MKNNKITRTGYLQALKEDVIIFDGAMGTNLDLQNLTADHYGGEQYLGCNDHLSLTYPKAVENVHRAFFEAGVNVIETNTFRSNSQTLGEFGLQDLTADINQAAARLAHRLAEEYSTKGHPCFAAGSMGPTGKLLSLQNEDEERMDFDRASEIFCQQAENLIIGGVDLLLLETQQDILEVKAAIHGIQAAFEKTGRRLPIQAQVTLDTNGRMLLGTDIQAVLTILEGLPIDVIGLNCSTGPEHMRAPLSYLSQHTERHISCLPNAGMPINRDGGAYYPLVAEDFAEQVSAFVTDFGINVVGGCCGTRPEHLRLLVEKLGNTKNTTKYTKYTKDIKKDDLKTTKKNIEENNIKITRRERVVTNVPALASAFQSTAMHQEPAPFIIGERLNTQGSRAFKRLMLAEDYEAALTIAAGQVENGAHALDVCTALTEDENETKRMQKLVYALSGQINAPLVIDSTDPQVLDAGLKCAPGRCLINSVHLESGEEKARTILKIAKAHNAAVIALTIDEKGMAKTAEQKLAVAKRIYDLAVGEHGLRPQDLVFDPLTFTLASGSSETLDAGIQTLDGLRAIKKELPGVFTSLGISNISFGLNPPARAVLNSVMLYHAIKAGLDMAILNPAKVKPYALITPEERKLAEDLIFNKDVQALARLSEHFAGLKSDEKTSGGKSALESLPLDERIRQRVLTRKKDGLLAELDEYIQSSPISANESALELLNNVLLPAMQEIGDQFGRGELILPFVLQSAEIMRAASDHLEQYLEKSASTSRGRLLLATVYGDVHDIGKNLIKIILSNNGYDVIDLGKQVPVETIIDQAISQKVDAIGLSALLVSTSQQMPLVVNALQEKDMQLPVLIGGAAVNQAFAERIGQGNNGHPYAGGVHYCADAFDALDVLEKQATNIKTKKTTKNTKYTKKINKEVNKKVNKEENNNRESVQITRPIVRAKTSVPKAVIPQAPFQGARVISLPLDALFAELNRSALFRISWGARNAKGEKWEQYQRDFTQKLEALQTDALENGWLEAFAAYGYFPCHSAGNDLVILPDPSNGRQEEIRFTFPRQTGGNGLCLADYFTDRSETQTDLAIFQIVTLGQKTADHIHNLYDQSDITSAFFTHGLAVQITETAAGHMHRHIRKELKLEDRQGKRYSWGFPAIPDLSQHQLLFKLLPAETELHIHLTSAFQFVPEYTTAALVVHHPQAQYYQINTI